jgi:hypothetical protein
MTRKPRLGDLDETDPMDKTERINLGMDLLIARQGGYGKCFSTREIAAWCDCSHAAIFLIEQRAIRHLRELFAKEIKCQQACKPKCRQPADESPDRVALAPQAGEQLP